MKKLMIIIAGLILLFFSSNSLACDPTDKCDECWTNSHWCKCVAEYNTTNSECDPTLEDDPDCLYAWSGIAYTDFSTCTSDLYPEDALFFGRGDTCVVAVCKMWMQYFEWIEYKNLGHCIVNQASEYDPPWPGAFGTFVECEGLETWVEGCECIKDVMWGD